MAKGFESKSPADNGGTPWRRENVHDHASEILLARHGADVLRECAAVPEVRAGAHKNPTAHNGVTVISTYSAFGGGHDGLARSISRYQKRKYAPPGYYRSVH